MSGDPLREAAEARRQREAETYVANAPGYARVFSQASAKDVIPSKQSTKVIFRAKRKNSFFVPSCLRGSNLPAAGRR